MSREVLSEPLLVYRIQKAAYRATALSGEGARRYGGRWNQVNVPLVYSSTNPELALLEMMVQLNTPLTDLPPFELLAFRLPPRTVEIIPTNTLPTGWSQRRKPYPDDVPQFFTSRLQDAAATLAFAVPSVILPGSPSLNVLINPQHSQVGEVELVSWQPLDFDDRLQAV